MNGPNVILRDHNRCASRRLRSIRQNILPGTAIEPDACGPPGSSRPPRLLAVAFNYPSHSTEIKIELPKYPNISTKEGRVIGTGETIEIPEPVRDTDYKGVVIGKRARAVTRESAYNYVAGYMTFNDVTSRDFQFRVSQYTLGETASVS